MKNIAICVPFLFLLITGCGREKHPVQAKEESKDAVKSENELVVDTFKSTAMMFPEYSTFEKDELGYDPCELLTMKAVTQTCKPTSTVSIYNKRQDPEKVCIYSWDVTDGQLCQVKFTILAYSLPHEKLASLLSPDKDGIIQHSDYGVRWIDDNKIMSVSYTGELIKKVNILDVKRHVKFQKNQ